VNPEQDSGSLADRAAAWVPPWERPTGREAPTERSSGEIETDPDSVDGAAALDREIDADIVREAGLPGPGTVETGDDTGVENGIESDTQSDAEAAIDSDAAAGLENESVAEVETTAAGRPADVAAGVEAEVGGWAESDEEIGTEPDRDETLVLDPSPLPGLAGAELGGALEAILMVVDEPVTETQLADVLDVAPDDVAEQLHALAADYGESGRGFELRRAAGGWRLYTRAEFSGYVERFVLDGQSARLTQAALETLAVVAYQQPVTRSRISAIRGVNCDGVVRTLVTRGLLEETGTQPETGAYLYRTTTLFLEKLGLDSVDELPPLAPFLPDDVNGLTDAQR
jgi:segregation and condensation protein B